jgi:hypothetical protein
VGEDESIAALLDEAEDIINSAGPDIRAEVDLQRKKEAGRRGFKRRWWRFGR